MNEVLMDCAGRAERDGALEGAADSKAVSTLRSATAVHEDSRFERSLTSCRFF